MNLKAKEEKFSFYRREMSRMYLFASPQQSYSVWVRVSTAPTCSGGFKQGVSCNHVLLYSERERLTMTFQKAPVTRFVGAASMMRWESGFCENKSGCCATEALIDTRPMIH